VQGVCCAGIVRKLRAKVCAGATLCAELHVVCSPARRGRKCGRVTEVSNLAPSSMVRVCVYARARARICFR